MKFVRCATDHTLSAISFPNRKFHACRNQPAPLNILLRGFVKTLLCFNGYEAVFKYFAILIAFPPRIDEMKDTIVGPNSGLDFLVNSYSLRWPLSCLVKLSSFMEF